MCVKESDEKDIDGQNNYERKTEEQTVAGNVHVPML